MYTNKQKLTIQPTGSVTEGREYVHTTRDGGLAQYGNVLAEYLVTAPIPSGQFDSGRTEWVTATNMTGGQLFAGWSGANTPAKGQVYSGGAVIAHEFNVGNRWGDTGLQTDVGGQRYTVGVQVVPDVLPSTDTQIYPITISIGSPGVITWNAHGLPANTPLRLSGPGIFPTNLPNGSLCYVSASGLSTNSFRVSSTVGGTPIATTGISSGEQYAIPSFPANFGTVVGPSMHAHKWWIANMQRYDSVMPGGYANYIAGGSQPGVNVPAAWTRTVGYWDKGIDFVGGVFSTACMNFDYTAHTSGSAVGGSLPILNPQRYLIVSINGAPVKMAIYNA